VGALFGGFYGAGLAYRHFIANRCLTIQTERPR
jgi:hypothetical protein